MKKNFKELEKRVKEIEKREKDEGKGIQRSREKEEMMRWKRG